MSKETYYKNITCVSRLHDRHYFTYNRHAKDSYERILLLIISKITPTQNEIIICQKKHIIKTLLAVQDFMIDKRIKWIFVSSLIVWILASVIGEFGYITYISVNNKYSTEVCIISSSNIYPNVNNTTFGIQIILSFISKTNATRNIYSGPIIVYTTNNMIDAKTKLNRYYIAGSNLVCYISCDSNNCNIYLNNYEEYATLTISICLYLLSVILLSVAITASCFFKYKRRNYNNIDDGLRPNVELRQSAAGYGPVFDQFADTQHLMWKNKDRIDQRLFDELKKLQTDSLFGDQEVKERFKNAVHRALCMP